MIMENWYFKKEEEEKIVSWMMIEIVCTIFSDNSRSINWPIEWIENYYIENTTWAVLINNEMNKISIMQNYVI